MSSGLSEFSCAAISNHPLLSKAYFSFWLLGSSGVLKRNAAALQSFPLVSVAQVQICFVVSCVCWGQENYFWTAKLWLPRKPSGRIDSRGWDKPSALPNPTVCGLTLISCCPPPCQVTTKPSPQDAHFASRALNSTKPGPLQPLITNCISKTAWLLEEARRPS